MGLDIPSDELIKMATGRELSPDYFLRYIREKYLGS